MQEFICCERQAEAVRVPVFGFQARLSAIGRFEIEVSCISIKSSGNVCLRTITVETSEWRCQQSNKWNKQKTFLFLNLIRRSRPESLMDTYTLALTFIVLGTLYLAKSWKQSSSRLPPGPRGWPLIGNLLDMPTSDEWVRYAEWVQEFRE